MKKYGKKGFTLIELIAVLVIMAIIALIVTPLVMSIIRKSKISARKRSVDAYGRSVELAIASYLLDTGTFPTDLHSLTVEYSGNTVVCNVMQMKENGGLYMSECSVNNVEVKDNSTEDGWYHYGTRDLTNAEYVDMYGKNVEAALKLYYDTNNAYPETIDALTIKSVGKTVVCESSINFDGTVYLTNCKVDGVSIADTNQEDGYYHYGKVKKYVYSIGDEVTYNGVDYYVIKDSGMNDTTLTMLKAEPLTVDEVNLYGGVGTNNNHVNVYINPANENYQTARDINGYGGLAYYTSLTCGYDPNHPYGADGWSTTGCKSIDYPQSDIKYVVDSWATDNFDSTDLVDDSMEYKARLLTKNEYSDLFNNDWLGISGLVCWMMTKPDSSSINAETYGINNSGYNSMRGANMYSNSSVVRPVVTISKSAL